MIIPVVPVDWGFCDDPTCPCWWNEQGPCDQWKEMGHNHPHRRCVECGVPQEFHTGRAA